MSGCSAIGVGANWIESSINRARRWMGYSGRNEGKVSITAITIGAFMASFLAAFSWGVALARRWHGGHWRGLCAAALLMHLWFMMIYGAVLLGIADSGTVGQVYLRPALIALFMLMAAIAWVFGLAK